MTVLARSLMASTSSTDLQSRLWQGASVSERWFKPCLDSETSLTWIWLETPPINSEFLLTCAFLAVLQSFERDC